MSRPDSRVLLHHRTADEPVELEALEPPPLLAHLGWPPTTVGLCGAKIMGVYAGANYPHICVVCKALDEANRA